MISSPIRRVYTVLRPQEKKYALVAVILSTLSNLLDLVGVAIFGLMGSLAISGVKSQAPGLRVSRLLDFIGLTEWSLQVQMSILGCLAVALLMIKTFVIYFGTKHLYMYFSRRSAIRSSQVLRKLLMSDKNLFSKVNSQEMLFLATGGITNLYLGVVANAVSIISDLALACVLIAALIAVTPSLGLTTLLYFSGTGLILYLFLRKKTIDLAEQEVQYGIASNSVILESLKLQPEILVRDTSEYFVQKTFELRNLLSGTLAMKTLLPNVSKFAIEASLTLGVFLISAIQFMVLDAERAFASLALFAAAGTRIAPSVLRIQQSALSISGSLRMCEPSLGFLENELLAHSNDCQDTLVEEKYNEVDNVLELNDVHFAFDDTKVNVIKGVSFQIKPSESIGIVGISGAGKSTLIDLCLGQLQPDAGEIRILGLKPREAFRLHPGFVSFVPQQIQIIDGSVLENLSLGLPMVETDAARAWDVLADVGLSEFVNELPGKLTAQLGENGSRLSGGQRQKIGIARALLTRPGLLILDEATSSMDSESEQGITAAIDNLQEKCSLIVVAHRLATLKNLKRIMIIEDGTIGSIGTFNELKEESAVFRKMLKENNFDL